MQNNDYDCGIFALKVSIFISYNCLKLILRAKLVDYISGSRAHTQAAGDRIFTSKFEAVDMPKNNKKYVALLFSCSVTSPEFVMRYCSS